MKRYKKKSIPTFEAIKFEYSEEGLKRLYDFCGSSIVSTGKDRHINAVGWAKITGEKFLEGTVAMEGDFIIKTDTSNIFICNPEAFELLYEEI